MAKDCPEPRRENRRGGGRSYGGGGGYGGGSGGGGYGGEKTCHSCGVTGHVQANCPDAVCYTYVNIEI
jgi:hypothetical protein